MLALWVLAVYKMPEMKKNAPILLHIVAWLCFLPSPFLLKNAADIPAQVLLLNILLPIIFYSNYLFAVPQLFSKRKFLLYIIFLGIAIAAFLLPNYLVDSSVISFSLARVCAVLIFSYLLARHDEQHKKREGQLGSELFALKAQINPHFLFNTLNNIYALTLAESAKAPEAIIKLASLMRYATDTQRQQIPLSEELVQINNYILLHRMRFSQNVIVDTDINAAPEGLDIAPFILIPLLEYTFLKGVNSQENSKLFIYFVVENNILTLRTEINNVSIQDEIRDEAILNIENARQRLETMYAGRYTLETDEHKNVTALLLKIKLK